MTSGGIWRGGERERAKVMRRMRMLIVFLLHLSSASPTLPLFSSRRTAKVRRSNGSRYGAKVTLALCALLCAYKAVFDGSRCTFFLSRWTHFSRMISVGSCLKAKVRRKMKVQLKCRFIEKVCTDRSSCFRKSREREMGVTLVGMCVCAVD